MEKGQYQIVQLNDYKLDFIILLISILIITVFSNIILIIAIKRSHTEEVMSASKRPNILMTTIAISSLILIANYCIKFFILVPIILTFNELVCLVIESITSYIFAISLYVISFTMALISIDKYYSFVRVFNNPLDKVSTNLLIKIIWFTSSILSLFFLLKSTVIYYDWGIHSIICYNYVNYLRELNENKYFRILYIVISFTFQYFIPAVIIFVFSLWTVAHFLRKYFQKKEICSELMIALKLILIFVLFIATMTTFHLYANNGVFIFMYDDQDPCLSFINNWSQLYMFMLSFTFHPIIYFGFSRVFWKRFYIHIVQRWINTKSETVRGEVIQI